MKSQNEIVKGDAPTVNFVDASESSKAAMVSPSNTMKVLDPNDPTNLLNSILTSRNIVRTSANAKLATLGQQMDQLVEHAKRVVLKCKRDERLHQVACNLQKKPGSTYYLYKKPNEGQEYFSMLSPAEWGSSLKSEYLGAYRLETDHSFTLTDREDEIDDEPSRKYRAMAEKICF